MKLILFVCIVIILMISFVSAEEVTIRFPIKQKESINLIESCEIEGAGQCPPDFKCNITIYNPNETIMVLNKPMTRNESIYNYTLSGTETSTIGVYENSVCCSNSSNGGCSVFYFEVTQSGNLLGTSHAIVYVLVLIGSLGIFGLTLFGAIKLPSKNPTGSEGYISHVNYMKHFKLGLGFISYLLMIWLFNILIAITNNFLFLDVALTLFTTIYFILLSGLIIVVPLTAFILITNLLNDKSVKQLLERGIKLGQ